jgi:peptidoglycan/LPS O-acetylase OafA/YrhL
MAWTLCLLVAVMTIVALTVGLVTGKPEPLATRIAAWAFTTLAVPLAVVGALIAARRPGNRVGILLLVAGLSIGVETVAEELTSYGVRTPGAIPGLGLIGWVSNLAWVPAILVLLLLPVLFGDPNRGVASRFFGHPVMIWLGVISYGIVLWHVAVAVNLGFAGAEAGFVPVVIGTTLLTIPLAAASYYLIERPLMKFKYRPLRDALPRGWRRPRRPAEGTGRPG